MPTTLVPSNSMEHLRRAAQTLDICHAASLGIHTIDGPEKEKGEPMLKAARLAIARARKLFVLGYGFDSMNSKRIGLDVLRSTRAPFDRTVFFTNFGGHNRVSMAASRVMSLEHDMFLYPNPPMQSSQEVIDRTYRLRRYEMSTKNVYDALNEDFESLETD